jgi:hypothetical protein
MERRSAVISGRRLAGMVRTALAGTGSEEPAPPALVWVDGAGAEVLVHLDAMHVSLTKGRIVVELELEARGWPRETLRLVYAVGDGSHGTGLRGVTDDRPAAGPLGARWAPVARAEVWSAVVAALGAEGPPDAGRPRSAGIDRGALRAEWDGPA